MRILRFFIFIFQLVHALDFNCPLSHCGRKTIKYPFKLQNQQTQICSNYINLTCSHQNVTLVYIPFSGNFNVDSIDYSARSIILRDPQNCLAKRLMNLNLSSSFFSAEYSQKYTFYSCPNSKLIHGYDLTRIDCLSISPNVTVASSQVSSAEMKTYGCTEIATREIPVSLFGSEYDTSINLRLRWNVPICRDCEEFYPQKKDESKNNTQILIAIVILIPLVIIVAFLVASYKRVANARASRSTTREAAQPQQTTTPTAVQLASVEDMMTSVGQCSMLKTVTLFALLEGNSGSLEDHDQGSCCTICLEEFSPQDIIRCLTSCRHYFHSRCIDQWFQDNSSCPICRNSIFNV